jgi:hypothetical protein
MRVSVEHEPSLVFSQLFFIVFLVTITLWHGEILGADGKEHEDVFWDVVCYYQTAVICVL